MFDNSLFSVHQFILSLHCATKITDTLEMTHFKHYNGTIIGVCYNNVGIHP